MSRLTALAFMTFVLIMMGVVVSCGQKGRVEVVDPGSYACLDTRDGETWKFDNATARDWTYYPGGRWKFTVTDSDGNDRTLTDKSELYLKCLEIDL